jgi:DUF1009 family protein
VDQNPERIAIVAGAGDFPRLIARAARSQGIDVIILGVKGFAEPNLADVATQLEWIELGQLDYAIRLLHKHGVAHLIMAGRIPHTSIFQYRHFDWRAIKLLARAPDKKADTLLGTLARELDKEGIQVLDSSLFLKSLMPAPGVLTPTRPPTARETEEIEFGYPIAKAVAGQDIGQTIVVKDKMVVAVEAAEGTDECIRRAGALAGPGCVVVKVSKPNQDFRFDIPVIGPGTIQTMADAGASALAVSAGESLIFDRERVLAMATQHNIAIVAR